MPDSILDRHALLADLQLAAIYAARAGILHDPTVIERLQRVRQDAPESDFPLISAALSDLVRLIAPLTLADLRCGRDPFDPRSHRKSRLLQVALTVLALFVLLLISYFMQALRVEEEAVKTLTQIQELDPHQKLTALRKLAQFERPLERLSSSYEIYHQKANELRQINSKLLLSYTGAVAAAKTPLFPTPEYLRTRYLGYEPAPEPLAPTLAASAPDAPKPAAPAAAAPAAAAPPADKTDVEICLEEPSGAVKLPTAAARYPGWIRSALVDSFSEFCFQLKVLAPAGQGTLLSESFAPHLVNMPEIKQKVLLRLEWFLPFFYGVLGSIVFALRNIANVRTAAVEVLPTLMRVFLGGVTGIVIGWFGAFAVAPGAGATIVSLPFALAFLAGYGIELLFSILDKLIHAVEAASPGRVAGRA